MSCSKLLIESLKYLSLAEAVERVGQLADVAVEAGNVEVLGLHLGRAGGGLALPVRVRPGRCSAHCLGGFYNGRWTEEIIGRGGERVRKTGNANTESQGVKGWVLEMTIAPTVRAASAIHYKSSVIAQPNMPRLTSCKCIAYQVSALIILAAL